MPFEALLNFIVVGALFATVVFTGVVGGRVERIGAAILGVSALLTIACQGILGGAAPSYLFMTLDLATAVAFGVLAVRNPEKLWPGVAGVAMTFVVAFSATRAIGFPLTHFAYVAAINLSSLLVEASLVAGAWNHRWGRKPAGDLELQPA